MSRISLNQVYSVARDNIARHYEGLVNAQSALSSGKRLSRPSDSPAELGRLFGIARDQLDLDRHLTTSERARASIDTATSGLADVGNWLSRLRELTVQGANGTLTASDRETIAIEVDQILQGLVTSANGNLAGRHVFGGTATQDPPFFLQEHGGQTRVAYRGNSGTTEVEIAPDVRIATGIPGSRIFRAGERGPTLFVGATGAASGIGTDSGVGNGILQVRHTGSSYGSPSVGGGADPISGLRPAANSLGNDTILGEGHRVTLTTDATGAGTLAINGGPPVDFVAGQTVVELRGPNGERVTVDPSGVAPNQSGVVVPLAGRGTLSLDGGTTLVPINFSADAQQVRDPATGAIVHVDSSGIRSTGDEKLTFSGTHDAFAAAIAIRDALSDDTLSAAAVGDILRLHLQDIDRTRDDATRALTELGARHDRLVLTENRLSGLQITLSGLRSQIEDVDVAKAAADLARYDTLYQASLLMASRVNQVSLLNYL